jgi:hypothetical protein
MSLGGLRGMPDGGFRASGFELPDILGKGKGAPNAVPRASLHHPTHPTCHSCWAPWCQCRRNTDFTPQASTGGGSAVPEARAVVQPRSRSNKEQGGRGNQLDATRGADPAGRPLFWRVVRDAPGRAVCSGAQGGAKKKKKK